MSRSLWHRSRWAVALVMALVSVLFAGACGSGEPAGDGAEQPARRDQRAPIAVAAGEPIVIGVSAPLTGPDEALGAEDRDAVIVGVERWKAANGAQIKGHEIQILVEDDGCTESEITIQAAERLLRQRGLVGVIGPDCSAGAQAAIPVYAGAGIVAISGSATQSDLAESQPEGRFFFRTAYRNDLEGALAGQFASLAIQAGTVYLVDDGESYGKDLANNAQRVMEESGSEVTRASVARGTVDFSELAAEVARENPDLVGFAGFNPEAALLYRQLRDAGYKGAFGAGDAAASAPTFIEPVGAEAEGVFFAGCSLTLQEDFAADLRELHGREPEASAFVAQYADAVTVLLDAVAEVAVEGADGSLSIDPLALRDAVRATKLEDGLSGSIAFDDKGDRIPVGVATLSEFQDWAIGSGDVNVYAALGLVGCQVQDGRLVNVSGPGAQPLR